VLGSGQRVVLDLNMRVALTGVSVSGFDQSGGDPTSQPLHDHDHRPECRHRLRASTDDGNYTIHDYRRLVGHRHQSSARSVANIWNSPASTPNGQRISSPPSKLTGGGAMIASWSDGRPAWLRLTERTGLTRSSNRRRLGTTFSDVENFIDRRCCSFRVSLARSSIRRSLPMDDALEQWYI